MPSNNTKIFVNKTLPDILENVADKGEYEPQQKRQKLVQESKSEKY